MDSKSFFYFKIGDYVKIYTSFYYRYEGRLKSIDEDSLSMFDKFGNFVIIRFDNVAQIEKVNKKETGV